MTNKEWLATLSAEDFYEEFKKAEEDGKSWTSTRGYVIQWLDEERRANGEPMKIYDGHEGKDKVCCNCRHNKRTPKKTYMDCNCDIDGHYIGYVQCFDNWCRHWARERRSDEHNT